MVRLRAVGGWDSQAWGSWGIPGRSHSDWPGVSDVTSADERPGPTF